MVPGSVEPELADPAILVDVDNVRHAVDDNRRRIAGGNRYLELCGQVGMLPGIVVYVSSRFRQEVKVTVLASVEYLLLALCQGVAARLSGCRWGGAWK